MKTIKEIFIKGTEPTRKDNLHVDGPDRLGDGAPLGGWLHRAEGDQDLPRLQPGRGALPAVAAVHPGVGAARRQGRGRFGRPEADTDDVLLQPQLPSVRRDVGRAVQADRGLCRRWSSARPTSASADTGALDHRPVHSAAHADGKPRRHARSRPGAANEGEATAESTGVRDRLGGPRGGGRAGGSRCRSPCSRSSRRSWRCSSGAASSRSGGGASAASRPRRRSRRRRPRRARPGPS